MAAVADEPVIKDTLAKIKAMLARDPGLRRYLLPASGGVVWRVIAGTARLSAHSFAAAVDVSPRGNPYWRNLPRGTNMLAVRQAFPPAIVAAFEAQGFIWGGKWSEFDLMAAYLYGLANKDAHRLPQLLKEK